MSAKKSTDGFIEMWHWPGWGNIKPRLVKPLGDGQIKVYGSCLTTESRVSRYGSYHLTLEEAKAEAVAYSLRGVAEAKAKLRRAEVALKRVQAKYGTPSPCKTG